MARNRKPIDLQKARQSRDDALYSDLRQCMLKIYSDNPWEELEEDAFFLYVTQERDRAFFAHFLLGRLGPEMRIYPSFSQLGRVIGEKTGKEALRGEIEAECWGFAVRMSLNLEARELETLRRHGLLLPDGVFCLYPFCKRPCRGCRLPQGDELLALLDCLGNFQLALDALLRFHVTPRFSQGELLVRMYNPQTRLWDNFPGPFPPLPAPERRRVKVRRLPGGSPLAECPKSETVRRVEFDFGWRLDPMPGDPGDAPYYPAVAVFSDRRTQQELASVQLRPEELVQGVLSALCGLIAEIGLPETLYVSRDETEDLVAEMAEKLGIAVKRVKALPGAGRLLRSYDTV